MISVLTLTYQRHHILEEAIQSYLLQQYGASEMVVINDSPEVQYVFNHPNVRIINHPERFTSVGKKLEWGYKQCIHPYIYRLDDDDLLAPGALKIVEEEVAKSPGYQIYRSKGHYLFDSNVYKGIHGSINNGNVYTRKFLDGIRFPNLSGDEDMYITFRTNANICEYDRITMIYRWGMNTYHISGMGIQPPSMIQIRTDRLVEKEKGVIDLTPKFNKDYWGLLT